MPEVKDVLLEAAQEVNLALLSWQTALRLALTLLVGAILIQILLKIMDRLILHSERVAPLRVYLRSGVKIALWFVLLLVLAGSVGIDVSSLIALLGVVGLAVSLALQNTLSNLAGGLQILLSRPFTVGDYVDTQQGSGTVEEIGLAYTRLVTPDNKSVLIPNSLCSASHVVNYTALGKRRMEISINLSADCDPALVRETALEVLHRHPQFHADPAPAVRLMAYKDWGVEYSIRAWLKAEEYWDVYFSVMEQLLPALKAAGVPIAFQQLNVRMAGKSE